MYSRNYENPDLLYDDPYSEDIVDVLHSLPELNRSESPDTLPFINFDDKELLDLLNSHKGTVQYKVVYYLELPSNCISADARQESTELPVLNPNVVVANHQSSSIQTKQHFFYKSLLFIF